MSTFQKTTLTLMLLLIIGYSGYRYQHRTHWLPQDGSSPDTGLKERLEAADKQETRAHIHELVIAETNNYQRKRQGIGGISGAEVQVCNRTKYLLERVEVNVQYRKRNGKVLHTERLVFEHLEPAKVLRLPVPDSRRGFELRCSVEGVKSEALGM